MSFVLPSAAQGQLSCPHRVPPAHIRVRDFFIRLLRDRPGHTIIEERGRPAHEFEKRGALRDEILSL